MRGWAHQHAFRFLSDAIKSPFSFQFNWFWFFLVIYKGRVQNSELEMQNPNTAIQWARQAAQHTLKVQLHTEGESFTEEPKPYCTLKGQPPSIKKRRQNYILCRTNTKENKQKASVSREVPRQEGPWTLERWKWCAVPRQSPQRQQTMREGMCSAVSAQPGIRPSNLTNQIWSLETDNSIKMSYLLIELIIFGGQVRKPSVFKLLKKPQFLVKNKNYMLLSIKWLQI